MCGGINLNLLPALEALLGEASVGGAARRAHVTQSAMSHSLKKLREALGNPLLVPSGRALVLTPRAREIQCQIGPALDALGAAIEAPRFNPRTSARSFRIATLDYFELTTLPESARAPAGPRAEGAPVNRAADTVALRCAGRGRAIDAVLAGAEAKAPPGVRRIHLHDDPFAVIVRPGHPRVKRTLDLPRYLAEGHVLVSVEGRRDGAVDRALAARGLRRDVVLRVPHFVAAPLAVMQSDWISTLARRVAERARTLFGVRVLSPPLKLPAAGVAMFVPERHAADPAARWLEGVLAPRSQKGVPRWA